MRSIYNITKGQLITLWVFGIIGWIWALLEKSNYYYNDPGYLGFLLWFIPLVLVFYTIGWKNHRKNE